MSTPDHYAILGAERTSSPSEIRQAFRRAAMDAHPDRGGSDEAMAAVNRAFEVLGDPELRARYDATGQDAPDPILVEAAQVLAQIVTNCLVGEGGLLQATRREILKSRANAEQAIRVIPMVLAKIRARAGKITRKGGGENLLQALIDDAARRHEAELERAKTAVKVFDAALEMLAEYESTEQDMVTIYAPTGTGTTAAWRAW